MALSIAVIGQGAHTIRGSANPADLYSRHSARSARPSSTGLVDSPIPVHFWTNSGRRARSAAVRGWARTEISPGHGAASQGYIPADAAARSVPPAPGSGDAPRD